MTIEPTTRSRLSKRVQDVPPSGIRKFFDVLATMPDVISLGVGEPALRRRLVDCPRRRILGDLRPAQPGERTHGGGRWPA